MMKMKQTTIAHEQMVMQLTAIGITTRCRSKLVSIRPRVLGGFGPAGDNLLTFSMPAYLHSSSIKNKFIENIAIQTFGFLRGKVEAAAKRANG
jgi:hypothetical protein